METCTDFRKGLWIRAEAMRGIPGRVMHKSLTESRATVGTPGCWRCQNHGSSTRASFRQQMVPSQKRGHVDCEQQGHGTGLHSPVELTSHYLMSRMQDMELWDLMFALLGLVLPCPCFLSVLHVFLLERHCILEVCFFLVL